MPRIFKGGSDTMAETDMKTAWSRQTGRSMLRFKKLIKQAYSAMHFQETIYYIATKGISPGQRNHK